MSSDLTSEQKLDAIYTMLHAQQSSLRRIFWYKVLKWCIIIGLGYITLSNPGYVSGKLMEYLQPIILEQMQSIMSDHKDGLMDQVKKMMPKSDPVTLPSGSY